MMEEEADMEAEREGRDNKFTALSRPPQSSIESSSLSSVSDSVLVPNVDGGGDSPALPVRDENSEYGPSEFENEESEEEEGGMSEEERVGDEEQGDLDEDLHLDEQENEGDEEEDKGDEEEDNGDDEEDEKDEDDDDSNLPNFIRMTEEQRESFEQKEHFQRRMLRQPFDKKYEVNDLLKPAVLNLAPKLLY